MKLSAQNNSNLVSKNSTSVSPALVTGDYVQHLPTLKQTFFLQLDVNGQPLHPYIDSQMGSRSLPNSSSEMCLRSQEEHMDIRSTMRKHSSMTRLSRDSLDGDGVVFYGSPRRIVDSCVQTDDEDGEER